MSTTRNQQEILEKLKKVLEVTRRIKKSEVARYLGIPDIELLSIIADFGKKMSVVIDDDYIVVEDFNSFVEYTDQLFASWSDMESAKQGKLDTLLETGTRPKADSTSTAPVDTTAGIASTSSSSGAREPVPSWRKKYDFNLKLGNAAIKDGKLDVALDRFKSARDVAEENYDADLTLEAGRLVEQVVQAKLDSAQASYNSGNLDSALAEFKAVKSECERLGYRDGIQVAEDYIAKIEAKLSKDYHGTKLVGREYDVMAELERLVGETIPKVSKVEWDTFGFVEKGGHVVQLGLYKKGLTSLPETIGNLKSLKKLWLYKNNLTSLPGTIGQLKNLQYLYLNDNNLTSLPETLERWIRDLENDGCDVWR
ncbi:MAG: leucine-rich repeat domain-containing protein [Promethearchaeota archaeon]